jgi:tetratricopeptide (TPR) repeat protein
MRAWLVLCVGLLPTAVHAQRPAARVPSEAQEVVAVLPDAYALARDADPVALLALASRTGDPRLADRAAALIDADAARANVRDGLLVRAWAAQHRHRFGPALSLLDRYLEQRPGDATARELRAQIQLTRGALRAAGVDCVALALSADAARGTLCTAQLLERRGRAAEALSILDRWLALPGTDRERRRQVLVLRAELLARSDPAAAESDWREALALAPDDVRTLASFARGLRRAARPRDVIELLASAPDIDALTLERALALRAAGDHARAQSLQALLERRIEAQQAVGDPMEARLRAELALSLQGDPAGALVAALENFATQREPEDVDLLLRAAAATRRPDALAALEQWRSDEGIVVASP